MSAPAQAKTPPSPQAASLSGAEKVAVLLLALGKPRAAKLLKRFDPEELKILTQLAGDLNPSGRSDLEALVEEFAKKFSSGINFVGTQKEVNSLLSDVMGADHLAGVMTDEQEEAAEAPIRVWDQVAKIKDELLRAYLSEEHPQTAAMILSRIDAEVAAKIVAGFPAQQRNDLLIRMLGIKKTSDDAVRAVELAIAEEWLAKSAPGSHAGIADILNRLDKTQSEDLLKNLAESRPGRRQGAQEHALYVCRSGQPAAQSAHPAARPSPDRTPGGFAQRYRRDVPVDHPSFAGCPVTPHGGGGTARRRLCFGTRC